jgi:CCR4-NOT transcriptional regulation complex NOT5 subunit
MAFITVGGNVTSYAEYTDLVQKDQRVLESNELVVPEESGFVDITDFLEDMLTKSTDRINVKIKASSWWQGYLNYVGQTVNDLSTMPDFNPDNIKSRQQDFTDMCVYYCLYNYLLPLIADFGNPESNEVQKIQYYESKFNDIFRELLALADWYDADGDGVVEDSEKAWSYQTVRRSRRRSTVVKVR